MTKKAETGTYHGRRSGPPGDDTVYWMPRDFALWEKAWDVWLDENVGSGLNIDGTPGRASGALSTARRGQGEADMSPEAVAARAEAKRRHAEAIAYVTGYQGSWGLPLDIRANPKWGTKYLKLSEAQVDALLKGRDRDRERDAVRSTPDHQRAEAFINAKVSARTGSNFFQSLYYQLDQRPLTPNQIAAVIRIADEEEARVSQPSPSPQDAGVAPQSPARSPMGGDVEDGWYMVDGAPWKVQWNRERTRKYAKRLDGESGDWEYIPGGLGIVARTGTRMTVEEASAFGKLYGRCAVCGRTLTNEVSIERAIGPICFGRIA